ncbi:MAG TPA: NAD-dependent epimerase/dehydratase family protein [Streptosporangiaceae bacterium]|nr:NAD-dependent epimerase/dehydratase family protein [Streptosporangiaceae bacterium]
MRLLITGGSGFLGRHVLREAARRGHVSVALTRSDAAAAVVASLGARPVHGDLDVPAGLGAVFASARCDALVNLASLGFGHAPAIVEAAAEADLRRAVFVSTTAVATTLPAPAKQVRLAAERRIRLSELDWTILRPTMIYGAPGDRNLSRLLVLLSRAPAIPVPGGGRGLQQPVHVADAAAAVLSAVERPATAGRRYDVAGPEPLSFASLLRTAASAVASRTRLIPVPMALAIAVARGCEQVSRRRWIRAEQLRRLAEDKAFSIEDAARDLGYSPRSFPEGIRAEARAMGLAR